MNFKRKPLAAAAIFSAAVVGALVFVAAPLADDIKKISQDIRDRQIKMADYDRRISSVRGFKAFAGQESANLEKIGGSFVDSQMPLDFINSLESAAREAQIKIEFSSSASQYNDKSNPPAIGVEAGVSGSISGIVLFLKKIESSRYLVAVKSIAIDADDGAKDDQSQTGTSQPAETVLADQTVDYGKAHILLEAYAK